MTLVLSALTQHEVIQVSDRRFTYLTPDGSVRSSNDEKNKAVLFCGRLMFAFTGMGELGKRRRTDLWLADQMPGDRNETPAMRACCFRASPRRRPSCFVGLPR